jgi:outer membrane lipoprotein
MKTMRSGILQRSLLTVMILLMLGCMSVISRQALKEVDPNISFEQLQEDPEAFQGKTVLLGGNIIETKNLPDKTLLIVVQHALGLNKKPVSEDVSLGRFIISAPGFLDPAIYRTGRKVTVVGTVIGKDVRPLGELKYTYPVISKKELHIWPSEESYGTEPKVHFGVGVGIGL